MKRKQANYQSQNTIHTCTKVSTEPKTVTLCVQQTVLTDEITDSRISCGELVLHAEHYMFADNQLQYV